MRRSPRLGALVLGSVVGLAACAPAARVPAAPGSAPAGTSAAVEPERMTVTADDGFQLTMWRKAPPQPRRAVQRQ